MNQHQLLVPLVFCLIVATNAWAQQTPVVQVDLAWHTISDSSYGVHFRYAWVDMHVRSGTGHEIPLSLDVRVTNVDVGIFELTSAPIAVPKSGMIITYSRMVGMYPSMAERGTVLANNPSDRCQNNALGVTRAGFHQRVDILDAATHKILKTVDAYRFNLGRETVLNDIVNSKDIEINLSPYIGKAVVLRAWTSTGYNGRGPTAVTVVAEASSLGQGLEEFK